MGGAPRADEDDGMTKRQRGLARTREAADPLAAGRHVVVTCGVLRGRTGTLERPARVVVDQGWMVAFDGRPLGLRRTRIATWALAPTVPVPQS